MSQEFQHLINESRLVGRQCKIVSKVSNVGIGFNFQAQFLDKNKEIAQVLVPSSVIKKQKITKDTLCEGAKLFVVKGDIKLDVSGGFEFKNFFNMDSDACLDRFSSLTEEAIKKHKEAEEKEKERQERLDASRKKNELEKLFKKAVNEGFGDGGEILSIQKNTPDTIELEIQSFSGGKTFLHLDISENPNLKDIINGDIIFASPKGEAFCSKFSDDWTKAKETIEIYLATERERRIQRRVGNVSAVSTDNVQVSHPPAQSGLADITEEREKKTRSESSEIRKLAPTRPLKETDSMLIRRENDFGQLDDILGVKSTTQPDSAEPDMAKKEKRLTFETLRNALRKEEKTKVEQGDFSPIYLKYEREDVGSFGVIQDFSPDGKEVFLNTVKGNIRTKLIRRTPPLSLQKEQEIFVGKDGVFFLNNQNEIKLFFAYIHSLQKENFDGKRRQVSEKKFEKREASSRVALPKDLLQNVDQLAQEFKNGSKSSEKEENITPEQGITSMDITPHLKKEVLNKEKSKNDETDTSQESDDKEMSNILATKENEDSALKELSSLKIEKKLVSQIESDASPVKKMEDVLIMPDPKTGQAISKDPSLLKNAKQSLPLTDNEIQKMSIREIPMSPDWGEESRSFEKWDMVELADTEEHILRMDLLTVRGLFESRKKEIAALCDEAHTRAKKLLPPMPALLKRADKGVFIQAGAYLSSLLDIGLLTGEEIHGLKYLAASSSIQHEIIHLDAVCAENAITVLDFATHADKRLNRDLLLRLLIGFISADNQISDEKEKNATRISVKKLMMRNQLRKQKLLSWIYTYLQKKLAAEQMYSA